MPSILGIGNPLLDISADVTSEILTKYNLKPNDAILAEEPHLPLYEDLKTLPGVEYIAGGATQNSIRAAKWLAPDVKCSYMGCVGSDEDAKTMESACHQDGVDVCYMHDKSTHTGTCAVCITDSGKCRSLVANLAAANNFSETHIKSNMEVLEQSEIIYSAGFFITVSPASIKLCREFACEKNKIYAMNISAPFIVQVPPFLEVLKESLPYVDVLFGNEDEATEIAKSLSWETSNVDEIAKRLSVYEKVNKQRERWVIITQGCQDTIVAISGSVKLFPITVLPEEKIVDTNAAGDSYVGGFLAALSKGGDVDACCNAGAYAASEVIQQSGCKFPNKPIISL